MNKDICTKSAHLIGIEPPYSGFSFFPETATELGLEKTILLEHLYRKYTLGNEFSTLSGQIFFGRMWYEASIEDTARALPFFDETTVQQLWNELVSDGLLHAIPDAANNGHMLYAIDFDALDTKLSDTEQD